MKFDKSRVYTAVNADELRIGDKIIVANTVDELRTIVISGSLLQSTTLAAIDFDYKEHRFMEKEIGDDTQSWSLAYLVERAKKWRAYKDCNEMAKDFKRRYGNTCNSDNPMWHPLIWVKCDSTSMFTTITAFDADPDAPQVYIGGYDTYSPKWLSLDSLFTYYTYMDGSPCGIEE